MKYFKDEINPPNTSSAASGITHQCRWNIMCESAQEIADSIP